MTPTTKAAVVEALKIAVLQNEHDMLMTGDELRQCEAAIALLGSEPPLPIKGITRDDTVHGEEYFTRAMVESMLWAPEPETTVTERDPHPNAFMRVPKGTEIKAHWPSLAEPTPEPGEREALPLYVRGPYPDGMYGLCELGTGRILQKFPDGESAMAAKARASLPPAPTKGTE